MDLKSKRENDQCRHQEEEESILDSDKVIKASVKTAVKVFF